MYSVSSTLQFIYTNSKLFIETLVPPLPSLKTCHAAIINSFQSAQEQGLKNVGKRICLAVKEYPTDTISVIGMALLGTGILKDRSLYQIPFLLNNSIQKHQTMKNLVSNGIKNQTLLQFTKVVLVAGSIFALIAPVAALEWNSCADVMDQYDDMSTCNDRLLAKINYALKSCEWEMFDFPSCLKKANPDINLDLNIFTMHDNGVVTISEVGVRNCIILRTSSPTKICFALHHPQNLTFQALTERDFRKAQEGISSGWGKLYYAVYDKNGESCASFDLIKPLRHSSDNATCILTTNYIDNAIKTCFAPDNSMLVSSETLDIKLEFKKGEQPFAMVGKNADMKTLTHLGDHSECSEVTKSCSDSVKINRGSIVTFTYKGNESKTFSVEIKKPIRDTLEPKTGNKHH